MSRIVFLDTETGGTDEFTHSLLEIGACILNTETGHIEAEIEIPIYDPPLTTTPEALNINKIDLNLWAKIGLPYDQASARFQDWLQDQLSPRQRKWTPGGHNLGFDKSFLKQQLRFPWDRWMSYSGIDTQNNARFFIDAGVQDNPRTGLSTQLKLYEINIDNRGGRARHSALGDAKGTALVYQAQLTILSGFWQIMTRGSR